MLRNHRLDAALIALAAVVLATSLGESLEHVRYGSALLALALLVLLGRRWRPPAAAVVSFAIVAVGGHVTPQISAPMFVSILVCFGVTGTLGTRRAATLGWAVGCVALVVAMAGNPYVEGASDVALTLTFCTIIWGAGLLATERARAAGAAHAHAEQVQARRDLDVAEATAHERDRIAGELHDIVSHGLSIVILQTVAARMALADGPPTDEVGAHVDRRLATVEATAREGLDDMRRLLDLLRPVDGADQTEPSTGLAQLPALVSQAQAAGLPVVLECDSQPVDLPAGLDTTAYRIVQEAITNVLKHAPGARTCVQVRRTESQLQVEVRNTAGHPVGRPPQGAGYGLIGMRQRAELYGAQLEAGACGDGFRVTVQFPLRGRP